MDKEYKMAREIVYMYYAREIVDMHYETNKRHSTTQKSQYTTKPSLDT